MKKEYSEEFRRDAVKLYLESGKSMEIISLSVGVHKSTLYHWVTEYKQGSEYKENVQKKKKESNDADKKRIRELEKENRELYEANKLLKKSMAIFCKDLDKYTSL